MKTKVLALALGCSLSVGFGSGCSAFDFQVDQSTDEVVLTGNLQLFQANLSLPPDIIPTTQFTFELGQEPAGAYLDSAALTLTDTVPAALSMKNPFSFIRHLRLEIAPTTEGSTLATVPLAETSWPQEGAVIHLNVDGGLNLLPYVREGFELRSILDGRVPAADLSFKVDLTIGIDVF